MGFPKSVPVLTAKDMCNYDDNFGEWVIQDKDDIAFYNAVQRESVRKRCVMCDRMVRLRPDYDKCNSCEDKFEH